MFGKDMRLNEKTKNIISLLARMGLSVALLLYVFSKIDLPKTMDVLKSASPMYLFVAAAVFLVVNGLLLCRWFIFIKALDLTVAPKNAILHYFYGLFGNLFLPTSMGGDVLKVVGLCKGSTQKPRVVASVLLDRLSGFVSIVIIAIIAFIFGYGYMGEHAMTIGILIALMGAGSMTIVASLLVEPIYAFFCKAFNRLPKFKKSLMNMHYDIALLKQSHKSQAVVRAILLSCMSQVIFAFSYYLTAKALHQDIAIIYFLIFVPIICVISSFPSIGGLGVRELGAASLFKMIGVDSGIAVSLTLINFLFMIAIGLVGGVLYVYTLSTGRIQHHASDAGVEPSNA